MDSRPEEGEGISGIDVPSSVSCTMDEGVLCRLAGHEKIPAK